jgi:hypothetical protein
MFQWERRGLEEEEKDDRAYLHVVPRSKDEWSCTSTPTMRLIEIIRAY